MKRLMETLPRQAGVVALGLILALGGFALAGCGAGADDVGGDDVVETTDPKALYETALMDRSSEDGASFGAGLMGSNILSIEEIRSGSDSHDEAETESEDVREVAEEDEPEDGRKHWFISKETDHKETEDGVTDDGSPLVRTYSSKVTYERNDNGDVITQTSHSKQTSSDKDKSTLVTDVVLEYDRDEHGWPLEMRRTSTDTLTYIDEDGEEQTYDPDTVTSTNSYSYRYDSQGRVIKGNCSDPWKGTLELSYHSNGTVASLTRSYSSQGYNGYGEPDDEQTMSYVSTWQFDENGNGTEYVYVEREGSHSEVKTVTEYGEDGNAIRMTSVTTKPDGRTQTYVSEAAETKDAQGNVIKRVWTVEGDGEAESVEWVSNELRYVLVYMPDGSIVRSKLDYDENYNEVLSDTKTFEGPYSTVTYSYDGEGNLLRSATEYYDGSTSTTEYNRDAQGKVTKLVMVERDGTVHTATFDAHGNNSANEYSLNADGKPDRENRYEWTYIKHPSDFQTISDQYFLWGWE